MIINEHGKFINDGVYITYYSHLNRDDYQVKVIINGEVIKAGEETLDVTKIKEIALAFKSEYNFPIYDARGIFWSVFSDRWCISKLDGDFGKKFSDIAQILEFTEDDKLNIDRRPTLVCKWAFYQGDGKFKIYERKSKTEVDLYDSELYRGMCSPYRLSERIRDMTKYVSDKETYEGIFTDFINDKFVIIIGKNCYSDRSSKGEFKSLIDFVSKNDFGCNVYPIELVRDNRCEDDTDKEYLNMNNISMCWSSDETMYQDCLQMLYDAYCIVGNECQLPDKIKLCHNDIHKVDMILAVKNNECRVMSEGKFNTFNKLKRGDIISQMNFGTENNYKIVLEIDGWSIRYSDVQKIVNISSYWYVPEYLIDKDLVEKALAGQLKTHIIDVNDRWLLSSKGVK